MKTKRGFTLVEVLVSIAIFSIVVALVAKPTREAFMSLMWTRSHSEAASKNLVFLHMLGRDIRSSDRIVAVSDGTIELESDSAVVRWEIDAAQAKRNGTPLPISVTSLSIRSKEAPPETKHVLIRGDFAGLGYLECGYSMRINARE